MGKSFIFKGLLTHEGWRDNVSVFVDDDGKIESICDASTQECSGFALPGFQNSHSHAFQYAMAGLAEFHEGSGIPDDFWSWRAAMYQLALTISPDQLEDIAAMLYSEMLRHGYTSVAEFHYLHHDKNGQPYKNVSELGERLIAAAKKTGIKITLIPIFYQQGGFGIPPSDQQRRFISGSPDEYFGLLEHSANSVGHYDGASLGIGIHSLRAVKPEDVISVTRQMNQQLPFHIHVSEQLKEIQDCLAFHGKRPVQWLLDNVRVNENFHLIHATHLDDHEVSGIAKAGAHVVLCPSTEGNLGDGLFRYNDFQDAGGKWSIGTDSHIGLNPFEEIRILDYGQRLITHKRSTFYTAGNPDSAFNALKMAWASGRSAMGSQADNFFEVGQPFDAVVIDSKSPLLATASAKNRSNSIIYSLDVSHITGTIVNGNWIVKNGMHTSADAIKSKFTATMRDLGSRM